MATILRGDDNFDTSDRAISVQEYTVVEQSPITTQYNASLDFYDYLSTQWGFTDFGGWDGSGSVYENADALELIFSNSDLYSFSMTSKSSGTVYTFTFDPFVPPNFIRESTSVVKWDKASGSWGGTGIPADWQSYNYAYSTKDYSEVSVPAGQKIIRYDQTDGVFQGATASGFKSLTSLPQLNISNHDLITVDSAGRVTMPYQPRVTVMGNTDSYQNPASNGAPPFTVIYSDSGSSMYNTSTHRYTAPVSGWYRFEFSFLVQNSTANEVDMWVNGARRHRFYQDSSRTWTGSVTIELNANDYVETKFSDAVYMGSLTSNGYSWATCQLVG